MIFPVASRFFGGTSSASEILWGRELFPRQSRPLNDLCDLVINHEGHEIFARYNPHHLIVLDRDDQVTDSEGTEHVVGSFEGDLGGHGVRGRVDVGQL
jgi:hypothetical protein